MDLPSQGTSLGQLWPGRAAELQGMKCGFHFFHIGAASMVAAMKYPVAKIQEISRWKSRHTGDMLTPCSFSNLFNVC